jgi:hypothetical protein
LLLRYVLTYFDNYLLRYQETEWITGNILCTYKGNYHLAWSIPLATSSYVIQSSSLHFFLMFVPCFVMYDVNKLFMRGIYTMMTGPILAMIITVNLHEQASIWCFFSIIQTFLMVKDIILF